MLTKDGCAITRKLNPLVFPVDQIVRISDHTATLTVLALSCMDIDVLNDVIVKTLSPFLANKNSTQKKGSKNL
jgi:hypothetical protein